MKTYTTPGAIPVVQQTNVVQQLRDRVEAAREHPALSYREGERFVDVSTADMWETVRDLAAGLIAAGVNQGDRVALHSGTRIEFTYFDYAIWAAGAATTTIYETSSSDQVKWILSDSGCVALISENADTYAVYESVAEGLTGCENVFVIDDGDASGRNRSQAGKQRIGQHRRVVERMPWLPRVDG